MVHGLFQKWSMFISMRPSGYACMRKFGEHERSMFQDSLACILQFRRTHVRLSSYGLRKAHEKLPAMLQRIMV